MHTRRQQKKGIHSDLCIRLPFLKNLISPEVFSPITVYLSVEKYENPTKEMKNDLQTFLTSVFLLSLLPTQLKSKEKDQSSVKIMEKITVCSEYFTSA